MNARYPDHTPEPTDCPVCLHLTPRQRADHMRKECQLSGLHYGIWFRSRNPKPDMQICWYCRGKGTVLTLVSQRERT